MSLTPLYKAHSVQYDFLPKPAAAEKDADNTHTNAPSNTPHNAADEQAYTSFRIDQYLSLLNRQDQQHQTMGQQFKLYSLLCVALISGQILYFYSIQNTLKIIPSHTTTVMILAALLLLVAALYGGFLLFKGQSVLASCVENSVDHGDDDHHALEQALKHFAQHLRLRHQASQQQNQQLVDILRHAQQVLALTVLAFVAVVFAFWVYGILAC